MLPPLPTILPAVLTLAQKAGQAVMEIYNSPTTISVTEKADHSPLTQADLAAESILNEGLKKIAPFPYLSEESKEIPFSERCNWETYWLVDPLDGTKEFLKRTQEFTVNIALLHKRQLILGVIYAPALEISYYGTLQEGSYRQIRDQSAEKLPLNLPKENTLRVIVSRSHSNPETAAFITQLSKKYNKPLSSVSAGSSLKFCLLAEGSADLYPRLGPTQEWDTAAGQAILQFCGGSVTDLKNKKTLNYNKKKLINNHFLASNRA